MEPLRAEAKYPDSPPPPVSQPARTEHEAHRKPLAGRLTDAFADHFRPGRMKTFVDAVGLKDSHNILDVGGRKRIWSYVDVEPKVTIANLNIEERVEGRFTFRSVDARELPFDDDSFDIAFSNSVIEHVGNREQQRQFADEVRRVARDYYVQTPNRWFFVEPHLICPFIHFLPRPWFRRLVPFFSVWYWLRRPSPQRVDEFISEINLLTEKDVREMFPDGKMLREKFLFFTKSFIVVRTTEHSAQ